jgi:stage III sporulation protein SpoIIIAA
MSELTLPTQVVKAAVVNPQKLIMYSPPKAGKTTLLSQLEGCLIIDLERGSKYVDALKIEVNNLDELSHRYYLKT